MVEVDQDGEVDLEQRLSVAWQSMLGQQEAAAGFIAESHRKEFGGDAGQIAFFNNRLVSITFHHIFVPLLLCSLFKISNFTFSHTRTSIGSSLTKVTAMTFLRSSSETRDGPKTVQPMLLLKTSRSLAALMTYLKKH